MEAKKEYKEDRSVGETLQTDPSLAGYLDDPAVCLYLGLKEMEWGASLDNLSTLLFWEEGVLEERHDLLVDGYYPVAQK